MIKIKCDISELENLVNEAIERAYSEAITRLSSIGEMYIAESRERGTFTDQTGNLRDAHSAIVCLNGSIVYENIGNPNTLSMFEQYIEPKGLQLIVGDGMEYASFVEGKGFDVSTSGFLMVEREVRKLFS